MRFLKFTTVYDEFIRQFLTENPDCGSLAFDEVYSRFVRTEYGLSDYYARHMRSLGHEAEDMFANLEVLQMAWARQRNINYREDSWVRDIVMAQVHEFSPTVLFLQDLYLFDAQFREQIRKAFDSRLLMLGWRAAPTPDFGAFQDMDLIFTSVPHFADAFRRSGVRSACLPFGFETGILERVKIPTVRNHEFAFLGNLGNRIGPHSERHLLLTRLLEDTPLQVWGERSASTSLAARAARKAAGLIPGLGKGVFGTGRMAPTAAGTSQPPPRGGNTIWERAADRCHPPVFGRSYYDVLANSRIVLNSHIDISGEYAGNMRLFEATGMGACLLTDWKQNLGELFEPEVEVVTYRSAEECVDRARYLLRNDGVREKIARAGQKRTLQEHNYRNRIQVVCALIGDLARDLGMNHVVS